MARSLNEYAEKRLGKEGAKQSRERARRMQVELHLADIRQSLGLSQTEVAKMLDVKQPSIAKFEKGGDIKLSTLLAYLKALDCGIELLAVDRKTGEKHTVLNMCG